MENLLQCTLQQKRQYLMEELLKRGIYKKDDKHLYELTLSDLEMEYRDIEQNGLLSHESICQQ
nr:Fur-regulated basic protein FbpA [Neobacillus sp. Marseille-Q6967]